MGLNYKQQEDIICIQASRLTKKCLPYSIVYQKRLIDSLFLRTFSLESKITARRIRRSRVTLGLLLTDRSQHAGPA